MDNRKWMAAAAGSAPATPASPSSGYPTDGNPGTATLATNPGAFWFHAIGEELRNVIAAAGLTPTLGTLTQLKAALDVLYSAPALQVSGLIKKGKFYVGDVLDGVEYEVVFAADFPTACTEVVYSVQDTNGFCTPHCLTTFTAHSFKIRTRQLGNDVQSLTVHYTAYGT